MLQDQSTRKTDSSKREQVVTMLKHRCAALFISSMLKHRCATLFISLMLKHRCAALFISPMP
jgi:hypothetical protein